MTTQVQAPALVRGRAGVSPALVLIAGWLIPGAGHFLLKKPIRGVLLLLSIVGMFAVGIGLEGKVYAPNLWDQIFGDRPGDLLDILGFLGDLGSGILYGLARALDWGHASVQVTTADYGTKFLVVSGLLNVVAAVDAHSLASGRKAS